MPPFLLMDFDDTLVRTSQFYLEVRQNVLDRLNYLRVDTTNAILVLEEIEARNIALHGFAKERFPLSLSELYLTLCNRQQLTFDYFERHRFEAMGWGVYDVAHPKVDGAEEILQYLRSNNYQLGLLTKGDKEVQRNKIRKSGLAHYFDVVEIVSDKKTDTYVNFVKDYGLIAGDCYMIGDSIKSDVNPALKAGLSAVYIPSPDAWSFEVEPLLPGHIRLESIYQLKDLFKGGSVNAHSLHNL
jgi:putative hydrolase of the HAD superfamily